MSTQNDSPPVSHTILAGGGGGGKGGGGGGSGVEKVLWNVNPEIPEVPPPPPAPHHQEQPPEFEGATAMAMAGTTATAVLHGVAVVVQNAPVLIQRCQRAYGWSQGYARRVLRAYRQFLELKAVHEDWDDLFLYPSVLVEKMWHQHILDVVNYVHDCMESFGHCVGHNPDGRLDADPKQIERTISSLSRRFGRDWDAEIWDFGPAFNDYQRSQNSKSNNSKDISSRNGQVERSDISNQGASTSDITRSRRRERSQSPEPSQRQNPELEQNQQARAQSPQQAINNNNARNRAVPACSDDDDSDDDEEDLITLKARDVYGSATSFTLNRRTPLSEFIAAFALRRGIIKIDKLRAALISPDCTDTADHVEDDFYAETLNLFDSPLTVGMGDGDEILIFVEGDP